MVRRRIDEALEIDDMYRRRRTMRELQLPRNFPQPQTMGQSTVSVWIRWMREENERILDEIEEEMKRRQDPDDPFDGTASGIFEPLLHDEREPLIPLLEEKKAGTERRKIEKSLHQHHQARGNDKIKHQSQKTKHKLINNQVDTKRKSNYLRESPAHINNVGMEAPKNGELPLIAEGRLINYSPHPQDIQREQKIASGVDQRNDLFCYPTGVLQRNNNLGGVQVEGEPGTQNGPGNLIPGPERRTESTGQKHNWLQENVGWQEEPA